MNRTLATALLLAATATAAHAAPQTYVLDPAHTAVVWHINHFGFSTPSGKFMDVSGSLVLDKSQPAQSSVELEIPLTKVNSGVPKLDEHLQQPDFFDTAKHPVATFKSTAVAPTGNDTAAVTGNLTIKGITKPVTLTVKLNKLAKNFMDKQTAGFTATGIIKRSDFGMTNYLPDLGDEVKLEIESEATLASPQ